MVYFTTRLQTLLKTQPLLPIHPKASMWKLLSTILAVWLALVIPFATYAARTITNPVSGSALDSSVMRNELQILENEIAGSFTFPIHFSATTFSTTSDAYFPGGLYASSTVRFGTAGLSSFVFNTSSQYLGLGTSTPGFPLTIASTTGPQLGLTDSGAGTNKKHWTFRSAGGAFYIATSTDAYATSTTPLITFTTNGRVGIGTSSPFANFSIGTGNGSSTMAFLNSENITSSSTAQTVNWSEGNSQLIRMGTGNITITFTGYTDGQKLLLTVCNPKTSSGTLIWANTDILWPSGTPPTKTTTAQKCDVFSFTATNATSTLKIFGASTLNF